MKTLNLIFKGMTLVVFILVNSSADASDMLSTQSTEIFSFMHPLKKLFKSK